MLIFFLAVSSIALSIDTNSTLLAKYLAAQAAPEKLPQVSASVLRTQLQQEANSQERQKLMLRLGEILVTEHCPIEAIAVLDSKELSSENFCSQSAEVSFWKAQALLALGKPSEAETLLTALLASNNSLSKEYLEAAHLALARADRALGKNEEALKIIGGIPESATLALPVLEERCAILLALQQNEEVERLLKDQKELLQQPRLLYLYAVAALQQGNQLEALRRFTTKKTDPSLGGWTSAATVAGIANCQTALKKPEEAQALLEKFLQENPNAPRLPELMLQLEGIYLTQHNKDSMVFYKWANDTTQPYRGSYAMLPLARMLQRQGHPSKSDAVYQSFLKNFPDHSLVGETRLEFAQNKLNQGDPSAALALLKDQTAFSPSIRARMAFLRGLAESALKHPERGEQEFHQAETLDPTFAADAQYNQMLLGFISHPNKGENSQEQKILNESGDGVERKEYLEVLSSDHGDRASAAFVIKKARSFLGAHPHSSLANEVRMKLGEALLRSGLIREARLELENVGHAESNSELGRQALLLAAQAAAHSMDPKSIDDAIMILEQVAQNSKGSNDAWQARLEQAALKNAQALPLEAIAIDDQILSAPEVPAELRYTAQMAKGDTFSGLGAKDSNNYRSAIATWRSLADTPGISPRWRNQALCKIGLIEEKLGESDIALATYYEAMKTPRLQEPEQLWHDKAAFEAARLLETRHQWNEAIQLYQQIISEGGPRSAEAKARISKLRLENLLWD